MPSHAPLQANPSRRCGCSHRHASSLRAPVGTVCAVAMVRHFVERHAIVTEFCSLYCSSSFALFRLNSCPHLLKGYVNLRRACSNLEFHVEHHTCPVKQSCRLPAASCSCYVCPLLYCACEHVQRISATTRPSCANHRLCRQEHFT